MNVCLRRCFAPAFFSLLTSGLGLAVTPASTASPAAATPPPPTLSTPQGKVTPPPGPIDIANEPIVRVVNNVLPAVVNITAEATVAEYSDRYDEFFRRFRAVHNAQEQSIGSGLIVSADGYIVTNAHVVALAEQERTVSVTLNSGSKYQAHIIDADDDKDLALLKIDDKTQFPYFDLSYVSPNQLGETVVAMGSPAGYQSSVSHGILSAKGRTLTAENHHVYNNLLQTDAAINPGNSGGPLVDLNGGLVGINSAKLAGEGIENIGFAIPNDFVVPWVNDAIAVARGQKPAANEPIASTLEVVRQRLGLKLKNLTPNEADELGVELNSGLFITDVEPGSPADEAGLRRNMIVVAFGNRQVSDERNCPSGIAAPSDRQQRAGARRLHPVDGLRHDPARWQRDADRALIRRRP